MMINAVVSPVMRQGLPRRSRGHARWFAARWFPARRAGRWIDDNLPLLQDGDPLAVQDLATHTLPLDQAPHAYEIFQKKQDGVIKILLTPN